MKLMIKGYRIVSALLLLLLLTSCSLPFQLNTVSSSPGKQKVHSAATTTKPEADKKAEVQKAVPVSWDKPSGGTYPVLQKNAPIWIDVSIKNQKVYIKEGNRTLYTMIASTGLDKSPDTTTPTGTYYVQAERGKWFYAPKYNEGAKYWVSWKNHGEFLFHSVPMNADQHILTTDAKKLGEKDSHGCIHLTVPDAKWIYEHIPYNTKVVIHG